MRRAQIGHDAAIHAGNLPQAGVCAATRHTLRPSIQTGHQLGGHQTGSGREQRTRLSQQLFAVALLSACTLILAYAATLSGAPLGWVAAWALSAIAGAVGAFVLIRSGWSLRFADPALTLWQMATSLALASAPLLA